MVSEDKKQGYNVFVERIALRVIREQLETLNELKCEHEAAIPAPYGEQSTCSDCDFYVNGRCLMGLAIDCIRRMLIVDDKLAEKEILKWDRR